VSVYIGRENERGRKKERVTGRKGKAMKTVGDRETEKESKKEK
jgi:hypothetical protein